MVGSVAMPARLAHALAPELTGRLGRRAMESALARAERRKPQDGNLFEPSVGTAVDGGYRTRERKVLAGVLIGVAALGIQRVLSSRASGASS
jgi:hypothetical protein